MLQDLLNNTPFLITLAMGATVLGVVAYAYLQLRRATHEIESEKAEAGTDEARTLPGRKVGKTKKSLLVLGSLMSGIRSIGVGYVVAGSVPLAFNVGGVPIVGSPNIPICVALSVMGIVVLLGGSYNFERAKS